MNRAQRRMQVTGKLPARNRCQHIPGAQVRVCLPRTAPERATATHSELLFGRSDCEGKVIRVPEADRKPATQLAALLGVRRWRVWQCTACRAQIDLPEPIDGEASWP